MADRTGLDYLVGESRATSRVITPHSGVTVSTPISEPEYAALRALADRLARSLRLSYSSAHRAATTSAREVVAEGRPVDVEAFLEAVKARTLAMSERVAVGEIQ